MHRKSETGKVEMFSYRYFIPFGISVFFASVIINVLSLQGSPSFGSLWEYFTPFALACFCLAILLLVRRSNKNLAQEIGRRVLICSLLISACIAVIQALSTETNTNFSTLFQILIAISLSSGLYLTLTYAFEDRELKRDQTRRILPLEILGVMLILIIFTLIKIDFFGSDFTGEHTVKYSSYVGPAVHMLHTGDPFAMRVYYLSDPVENPQGIYRTIGNLPVMEWGLAATYAVFPDLGLEFATRLFTHTIGILGLITIYGFFRAQFSRLESFFVTLLVAVNPIFVLSTFVTVYDSITVLLTFAALIFVEKYRHNPELRYVYGAGLIVGIATSMKLSAIVWATPAIVFLLLSHTERSIYLRAQEIAIFLLSALFSAVLLLGSVFYLPSATVISICSLVFSSLVLLGLFWATKKKYLENGNVIEKSIKTLVGNIFKSKILIFGLLLGVVALVFVGIKVILYLHLDEFLIDPVLFFNLQFYDHLIFNQIQTYIGGPIFYLAILGIFLNVLLYKYRRDQLMIFLSLLVGALTYLLIGAKEIFFQNYAALIILTVLGLFAGSGIYIIGKTYNGKVIIAGCLSFLLFVPIFLLESNLSMQYIGKQRLGFEEAAAYLTNTTNDQDLYIDDSYTVALGLKADRGVILNPSFLSDDKIRRAIQDVGFKKAMEQYNIKYLISFEDEPDYLRYAGMFSSEPEIDRRDTNRTQIILSRLEGEKDPVPNRLEREKILNEAELQSKFVLTQKIGAYKFYTFQD